MCRTPLPDTGHWKHLPLPPQVWVSVHGSDRTRQDTIAALVGAASVIRYHVAKEVQLRRHPVLPGLRRRRHPPPTPGHPLTRLPNHLVTEPLTIASHDAIRISSVVF